MIDLKWNKQEQKSLRQIELPSKYSPTVVLFLIAIGLTIFLSIIGVLYISDWELHGDD